MMAHGPSGAATPAVPSPPAPDLMKTTVTFLQMLAEQNTRIAAPANLKLMLVRAENISVGFYRYLYTAVGGGYHWIDRNKLDNASLATIIQDPKVEVWVLYASGQPAGYFEVDGRQSTVVELQYFGLLPEFHGLGLGKWLLAEAIRACWAKQPGRVIVETCTLDGPAALPLYQKLGFVAYDQREKEMEISG